MGKFRENKRLLANKTPDFRRQRRAKFRKIGVLANIANKMQNNVKFSGYRVEKFQIFFIGSGTFYCLINHIYHAVSQNTTGRRPPPPSPPT